MFELVDAYSQSAVIKVIGVGGGGGNAVQHMVNANLEGVDFICANTDSQALQGTSAKSTLQLGVEMTKGLGAGANPEVGRQSALEDRDRIYEVISGTDMLFITAGMGGGTGTGAAPIVAEVAKELGILTVAVVTKPFNFEGKKRRAIADRGILELSNHVDSLITIPNEKLLTVLGKDITMEDAFTSANDILLGAVQGIAEIITCPGLINVDFADVKTVMSEMGLAMMGSGLSQGTERAREAAESAISSPLLEDINITGARGILVNVTAGPSLGIGEIAEIGDHIEELAAEDATVVVGTVIDESMGDDLRVTLVATGIGEENVVTPQTVPESQPAVTDININRPRPESAQTTATANADSNAEIDNGRYDEALLDVPAFLRRQAD
jgi:cell division protein FtsZ